jgi:hypothetical protein
MENEVTVVIQNADITNVKDPRIKLIRNPKNLRRCGNDGMGCPRGLKTMGGSIRARI